LIDKVYVPANLFASYEKVTANGGAAGIDHVTVEDFTKRLSHNLERLASQLAEDSYRPQGVRRVHIPKPGTKETRPLGIPTVRDRVVQGALRHVLEPIFERQFAEHSYGFRPGRGCKDALRRVDWLLKQGYRYVVDVDLKSYFDTIPHAKLLDEVRKYVADSRVLDLIEMFLKAEIFDGAGQWTPEGGAPQGAVLSPLLSNLYLNEWDHQMVRSGYEMTRYADGPGDSVPQPRRSRAGLGVGASVDGPSGPDAASHEDQNRGCRNRRLRLSGLPVCEAPSLPAPQEPGEVPGRNPGENAPDSGP